MNLYGKLQDKGGFLMRIENIIPAFLEVYDSNQDFRMTDLEM